MPRSSGTTPARLAPRIQRAALLSCLLAFHCAARAQTPQTAPSPSTLHSGTTLVLVPALIQNPAKDVVYSLRASDFELTDNGVRQKLSLEAIPGESAQPLALVVLLQTGDAPATLIGNYAHLGTMLAGIVGGPPNKVAVVNFGSSPEFDYPFTSEVAEWSAAVTHPEFGHGGPAIFDAIAYALDLLRQQPPETRRAILLVSQQHDSSSKTKVKDIIREVGESNTAVYSLTFSTERNVLKGALFDSTHMTRSSSAPAPMQVGQITTQGYFNLLAPLELAAGAMRKNFAAEVATLSGGEPFGFSNPAQFDRALATLANHIRNGYVLSFRPTSSQPGLHTLKLSVIDHPELHIEARTSYWADEASIGSQFRPGVDWSP